MHYPEDFDDIVVTGRADLLKHPEPMRFALCMHRFEAEVNNGGLYQFFLNSSGELVPDTLEALAKIGAPHTKQLLEKAIAVAFPTGYPTVSEDLPSALADYDTVAGALEPLEASFFEYVEPLSDLVNKCLARSA